MTSTQEPQPANKKCSHFLAAKRRSCKMDATPGELYCGNHLYLYKGKAGEGGETGDGEEGWRARKRKERVPCPADPNHTVAKCDLQAHLARCPAAVEAAARQAVQYYVPDVNAGSDEEPDLPAAAAASAASGPHGSAAPVAAGQGKGAQQAVRSEAEAQQAAMCSPFAKGRAALRIAAAQALGAQGWSDLVSKLEQTFERECGGEPPLIELRPPECEPGLVPGAINKTKEGGSIRPFDEKHALQQASIVGHMLRSGILPLRPRLHVQGAEEGVLVELGAGKAGLSGMAIIEPQTRRACNIGGAVLVDNRASFQAKADRFMREVQLARIKMDLKDFQVRKAPLLQADLPARLQGEPQQGQHVQQQGYRSWACCAKHLCGAATDFGLRACLSEQQRGAHAAAGGSGAAEHQGRDIWDAWQGLAIATCCHHRCGWRSYVGKHIWKSWGLTALDFEIACAITGWALCGHDAPQGCTGLSGADDDQSAGRCSDDDEGCEQPQSKQQDEQPDSTDHTPVEPDIAVWPYLSRTQRMALGLKCKTMIDWGRAAYAAQQLGLQRRLGLTAKQGSVGDSGTDGAGVVQFVRYIRPDVSGENRLLVVRPAAASPVDGSPAAAV